MKGAGGLTSSDLEARLAKKFAAPEYAFLPQMNQGTGAHSGRIADAVAMSIWPSRGLHLHGFEIKVHRGDFLSEMKQPAKAEAVQRFCHFWWIVTAPGVIREAMDLIPPTWGWMETHGVGLVVKKQAPLNAPEPFTVPFIASLLRRVSEAIPYLKSDYVSVADVDARVAERVAEELLQRDPAVRELKVLQERVSVFEKASGVSISRPYDRQAEIGAAVKVVMNDDLMLALKDRIQWQRNALAEALKKLDLLCHEDALAMKEVVGA